MFYDHTARIESTKVLLQRCSAVVVVAVAPVQLTQFRTRLTGCSGGCSGLLNTDETRCTAAVCDRQMRIDKGNAITLIFTKFSIFAVKFALLALEFLLLH